MPDYELSTKKTWQQTVRDLAETFRLWGVGSNEWTLTALQARGDRPQTVDERRVVLDFQHPATGQHVRIEKGDLARQQDNLRAIYLSVESVRMIEKRGTADLVREVLLQI